MSDKAQNYRYIDDYGHAVVLTTYATGAADRYGDAILTAAESTITALRKMYRGNEQRDATGGVEAGDAVFYVKDTVSFPDNGTTPASMITDDGMEFAVVQVDNQRAGVKTVLVERKR